MMIEYPGMTVEAREVNNAHGLRAPLQVGSEQYREQMEDTLKMARLCESNGFPAALMALLEKYSPVEMSAEGALAALRGFGFAGWGQICDFVRDDECPEFFVMLTRWAKSNGFKRKGKEDFIDGAGVGVNADYLLGLSPVAVVKALLRADLELEESEEEMLEDLVGRLRSEGSLDKAFDVKHTFESTRPLVDLLEQTGQDFSFITNYVHPGHWRYPAGHGSKFFQAVTTISGQFEVPDIKRKEAVYLAYVAGMGRTGILVHLPEDNVASGALCGLEECAEYLAT